MTRVTSCRGCCRAVRELSWLGAETGSVRLSLHSLLSDAYSLDKQQHAQVQFLSHIDAVKRRVSRVSSQLAEMDSWRRKQDHLQAVVDSRDLYRIAAELQSLQSSMESLSALPAHYTVNQQQQVAQLRDRLEQLCEPALMAGLRTNDISGVARLSAIYRQMGAEPTMQRLYTAFRVEQVDSIARTYVASASSASSSAHTTAASTPLSADAATAPASASGAASAAVGAGGESETSYQLQRLRGMPTWLPSYFSDVSQLLIEESGWTVAIFSADSVSFSSLPIAAAVAERTSRHLTEWLTAWQSMQGKQSTESLASMRPIFASSVEFVCGLLRIVRSQHGQSSLSSLQQADGIVCVLLEPYRDFHKQVADTQKQSMLASVDSVNVGADDYDSAVAAVLASLPVLLSCSTDCVQQCLSLTGGLGAVGSLAALCSCVDELLTRLLFLSLRLRRLRDKDERRARREAERMSAEDPLGSGGDGWGGLSGLFALMAAVRGIEKDGVVAAEAIIRQRLLTHIVHTLAVAHTEDEERRDAQSATAAASAAAHSTDMQQNQTRVDAVIDDTDDQDDQDRVAIFACLLRADEQVRRSLEDVVEQHHSLGLTAITTAAAQTSRDSLQRLAAAPPYQPLNPPQQPHSASLTTAAAFPASSAVSPLLFLHSSFLVLSRLLVSLHEDVYDLLFAPLAGRLRSFASWKQWRSSSSSAAASSSHSSVAVVATELREDGSESEVALPSFSLQPSEYAVEVGEYLLTVVQQIEPFVAKQRDDDEPDGVSSEYGKQYLELDASYWLQRLASGTCSLLCSSIMSLPPAALQSAGTCRQLAADLDYIANVLQAINLSMEPQLVALMDAMACSGTELMQQRHSELSSNGELYTQAARTVLESRLGAVTVDGHSTAHSTATAATAATSK